MCCVEEQREDGDFAVTQMLVDQSELPEKVISKYPYCVSLGDMDEERKANVEDEEIRSA